MRHILHRMTLFVWHRTPSMKLDSNLESPILLNRALPLRLGRGNNRIQNKIGVEESEAIYTMAERYELQSQSGKGKMPTVDRTPTGIPGLDEILSGGFPRGRVILLVGGPGTGKTILTSQFLMNGIKIYGENGAFVSLDKTGATCLMTTELRAMGPTVERAIQLEEYLAHGVVIMSNAKVGKTYNRVLQVEKMRETPIDMQPRPYKISGNGIEVFPKETIFVD